MNNPSHTMVRDHVSGHSTKHGQLWLTMICGAISKENDLHTDSTDEEVSCATERNCCLEKITEIRNSLLIALTF